jgi:hypothetical protein
MSTTLRHLTTFRYHRRDKIKKLLVFARDSPEAVRSSSQKLPREAVLHCCLSIGHGTGNRTVFRVKQAARNKEPARGRTEGGENSRTVVLQRQSTLLQLWDCACRPSAPWMKDRASPTGQRDRDNDTRARIRHVAGTKIESARALAHGSFIGLVNGAARIAASCALTSALKLQPVPITRAIIRSAGRVAAADSSGCCETTNYRLLPANSCGTIINPEVDIRICIRDGNSSAIDANNARHPETKRRIRRSRTFERNLHDPLRTVAGSFACVDNLLLRAAISG